MEDFRPEEGQLPILSPKQTLSIVADVAGDWREIFWLKYTKRGDLLTYSGVAATRLLKGFAQATMGGMQLADGLTVVGQGERLKQRTHLTLHPSGKEAGMEKAVVNGVGGAEEISLDLRKIRKTQEAIIIQMTDPLRYPLWREKTDAIKFGSVFKKNAIPEFRVYVTPLRGRVALDEPIPFVQGYSADFIAKPVGLSTHPLWFQIRLAYQYREAFHPHHVCLIPSRGPVTGT